MHPSMQGQQPDALALYPSAIPQINRERQPTSRTSNVPLIFVDDASGAGGLAAPMSMEDSSEADESGMDTDHEVPSSSPSPSPSNSPSLRTASTPCQPCPPPPIRISMPHSPSTSSHPFIPTPTATTTQFVSQPSHYFSLSGFRPRPQAATREVTFPPVRKNGIATSASHHVPPSNVATATTASCAAPQPQPQQQQQQLEHNTVRPFAFPTTNPGSQFLFFSTPQAKPKPKPRRRTLCPRSRKTSGRNTPPTESNATSNLVGPASNRAIHHGPAGAVPSAAASSARRKTSMLHRSVVSPEATIVTTAHSSQGDLASIRRESPTLRQRAHSSSQLPMNATTNATTTSTSCQASSFTRDLNSLLSPLLSSFPKMRRWRGKAQEEAAASMEQEEKGLGREPCLFEVPTFMKQKQKQSAESGEVETETETETESEPEFPGSPLQLEESDAQEMDMEKKTLKEKKGKGKCGKKKGKGRPKKAEIEMEKELDSTSDMSESEKPSNVKKSKGSRVLSRQREAGWKKNKKNRIRSGGMASERENSATFSICPSCPCPINCIPGELLYKVLAQLDIPTLCSISCVCRHWYCIAQTVFRTKIGIGKPPYFAFESRYCSKGGGPLLFFNKPIECSKTFTRREAVMVFDPMRIPCEGPKTILCFEGRFRALHRLDKNRVVFKLGTKCCALYIVNLKHALAKKLLPEAPHGVTFVKGRGCKVLVGAYRSEGYRANYKVQRNQHDDDYSVESAPDATIDLYLIQTKTVHLDSQPVFENVRHIIETDDNTGEMWLVDSEFEVWKMSMDKPSCRERVLCFQNNWVLPLCTFAFSPSRQYLAVGIAERCHFKNVRHLKVFDVQTQAVVFELRDIPTRVCPMSSTPVTLAFVWIDDSQIQFSETRVTDTEWTVINVHTGERLSETKYARIGLYHIACKGFDCLTNKRKRNGMFEIEWPNIFCLGESEPVASLADSCGGVSSSELSVSDGEGRWVAYLNRLEACQWGAFILDARTRCKTQIASEWCYNFHWV